MRRLTVLYDAGCALCLGARAWLEAQPRYVDLEFVAAASDEARRRFPSLAAEATLEEMTVVGDGGEVYRGAKAWIVCLWALKEYREWAFSLATPERLPLARRFVHWTARHRYQVGARGSRLLWRLAP